MQRKQLVEARSPPRVAEATEQLERRLRFDPRHILLPREPRRLFERGPGPLVAGWILLEEVHGPAPVQLGLVVVLVVLATQGQAAIDARDSYVQLTALRPS